MITASVMKGLRKHESTNEHDFGRFRKAGGKVFMVSSSN